MPTTEIEIPLLPISFNQTRYASWQKTYRLAQPMKEALILTLNTSSLPKPRTGQPPRLAFIEASARLRFKDRRRRDEGNFRTPLEKTLGDVLTGRGYLPDDTPEHYRFGILEFEAEPGPPLTIISLNWKANDE